MNNIESLRDELAGVFDKLKAGTLQHQIAGELNNSAGKIIATLKVQLEYYALRKEKPEIPFLGAHNV